MRFAIEGQIENVGAADIFLFLAQTLRTSVVAFERPDQETRVFFAEGQPVWCTSTKPQLQIEARLSQGGGLKLRDIETALARQNASEARAAQALIAEKMATETSMEKDLRALAIETLKDVASWSTGTFSVYDGVSAPPWALTIAPDFPALLVEALRGQCTRESLQKEFQYKRGVLKPRASTRPVSGLNEAERTILGIADGERTVDEVCRKSGYDDVTALTAIHVLCGARHLDLRAADSGSPARSGDRPPLTPPPAAPPSPPAPPPPPPVAEAPKPTAPVRPEPRPTPPAPPVAPTNTVRASEPPARTSESTAKLGVLPEIGGPAPRALTRTLRIMGDEKNEDVVLTGATYAIGRHPRNDLVLKDPRISSFHCRIEIEGDVCSILDLKSRNGTLVNAIRVERMTLKPNDRIQLGSTKITYVES